MAAVAGGAAVGPDYTEQLNNIVDKLDKQQSYLNDKKLYFRECVLRLYANIEFDHNEKNARLLLKDCISRAKLITKEVFNTKV